MRKLAIKGACVAIASTVTTVVFLLMTSNDWLIIGNSPDPEIFESPHDELKESLRQWNGDTVIGILVIACERTTVSRCLKKLIEFRPSRQIFPILVSHGCSHEPTAKVINSFSEQVLIVQQSFQEIKLPKLKRRFSGYYNISRHYLRALNYMFVGLSFDAVIVVEDDLEISSDFYEYFLATYPILKADSSLLCVSAWNDNGRPELVEDAPERLYRTDFFPGLGWMLLKSTWMELEPKWPDAFWDDWLRKPEQMKGRACIRPEISRTKHFAPMGVSGNFLYIEQLQYMTLNENYVPFTTLDLNYLFKDIYDMILSNLLNNAEMKSLQELKTAHSLPTKTIFKLCCTEQEFPETAKYFKLFPDLRSSIPRTAYDHIVTFMYRNARIFLIVVPRLLRESSNEINSFDICLETSSTKIMPISEEPFKI